MISNPGSMPDDGRDETELQRGMQNALALLRETERAFRLLGREMASNRTIVWRPDNLPDTLPAGDEMHDYGPGPRYRITERVVRDSRGRHAGLEYSVIDTELDITTRWSYPTREEAQEQAARLNREQAAGDGR